jgi:hypothetical protein
MSRLSDISQEFKVQFGLHMKQVSQLTRNQPTDKTTLLTIVLLEKLTAGQPVKHTHLLMESRNLLSCSMEPATSLFLSQMNPVRTLRFYLFIKV